MKRKGKLNSTGKLVLGVMGIGILVFIIVFPLMVHYFGKNNTVVEVDNNQNNQTNIIPETGKVVKKLILLKDINMQDQEIIITDLDNPESEDIKLKVVNYTLIKDLYGKVMSQAELEPGQILDIKYSDNNKIISNIKLSARVEVRKGINNLKINQDTKKIEVDNRNYPYTNKIIKTYKGEKIKFTDITEDAVVDVYLYKGKIWSINVLKYNGYLDFMNFDKFIGADVEIDTDIFNKISIENKITLKPGTHKVVIKRDDIEPIVKNVVIEERKTTTIDLGNVEYKRGSITFNINAENYKIHIEDESKTINLDFYEKIVELPYGVYKVMVSNPEYKTIEKELKVFTPNSVMNINLSKLNKDLAVNVRANKKSADVYVNGIYYGKTPISLWLKRGNYNISVKKAGFLAVTKNINLNDKNEDMYFELLEDDPYSNSPENPNLPHQDVYDR